MANHNGRAEVRGVKYKLTTQPPTTNTAHACAGCVARHDPFLCSKLPDTCMGQRRIWIKEH